ncbi:MAG: response regulator [Chlorobi bacterium]|nr:response regulator [Chlorobiota bacterium]
MTSNHKFSVLYVDDELVNLELFKSIFHREYNVYTALSAKEGLEILKGHKIDLIVTDERMPLMSGVEFLAKIHVLYPKIPPHRLLTSGYSKPENIEKAFKNYQLNKFIEKPWRINELKKVVAEVLNSNNL